MADQGMHVKFDGLDALFRQFDVATSKAVKYTEAAMKQTVAKAQATSKGLARVRTGFMRQNINIKPVKSSGSQVIGEYEAMAEYSSYNEYGTFKMSAQPFMRPGVTAATPFFYQTVKQALMRAGEGR